MTGFIDIVCNIYTPEAVLNGWTGLDSRRGHQNFLRAPKRKKAAAGRGNPPRPAADEPD